MKEIDLTLYLVTDSTGLSENTFLETVKQACAGGVSILQLREKDKGGLDYLRLAEKVRHITNEYSIPLIIDDRVDVAIASGADGVHVGQSDLPVSVARELLGPGKIVGATAKTVEQAKAAKAQGANYLGVGAIYPTTTKVITVLTEVSTLNEIVEATAMPTVAIGGLNSANMHVLYDSLANGIAVVSAIMKSKNPHETAKELRALVLKNFKFA